MPPSSTRTRPTRRRCATRELVELQRRDHQQLRDALVEPDVWFIITPVAAEAHFMRDHDGEVKLAGEVERRRARMRREFGVDVV